MEIGPKRPTVKIMHPISHRVTHSIHVPSKTEINNICHEGHTQQLFNHSRNFPDLNCANPNIYQNLKTDG